MSSNYNQPKTGYTKTGKSLKAVRRYYALMNQGKSPKSPEEEKLSKRIAAELKTYQDANEKRSKREMQSSVPLMEQATDMPRSMPTAIIISPRDTGPVFISPTAPPPPAAAAEKSVKSHGNNNQNVDARSMKSARSIRDGGGGGGGWSMATRWFRCDWCGISLLNFILGFFLGVMVGAAIYHFAPRSGRTKIFTSTTVPLIPFDGDGYSNSPGDSYSSY